MAQAEDIIVGALRFLGIGRTESLDATNDIANNIPVLNNVIASMAVDGILIQEPLDEAVELVIGKYQYTIGVDGTAPVGVFHDFNTLKPNKLVGAYTVTSEGVVTPLKLLTKQQYVAIKDSSTNSGTPLMIFYDSGSSQQGDVAGTVSIYPVPE